MNINGKVLKGGLKQDFTNMILRYCKEVNLIFN